MSWSKDVPTLPGTRAYTVGNLQTYEKWRDVSIYKDVEGTVWKTLYDVLSFYIRSGGAVLLTESGVWVGSGVYAVELESSWEETTDPADGMAYASLLRPAKIVATVCTHTREAERYLLQLNPLQTKVMEMREPKQVIILRTDLKMPAGKAAAQAAHASLKAFMGEALTSGPGDLTLKMRPLDLAWSKGSHVKIVLGVDSESEMLALYAAAQEAGLRTALVVDEGRTIFAGAQTTALAIGPEYAEDLDPITGKLKLYR